MKIISNRLGVLLHFLTFQSKSCPFCRSQSTRRIGSNAYLSHVRECDDCRLIYRWPKQTDKFNRRFYQLSYIKLASENMHLPTKDEVGKLLQENFAGHHTSLGIKREIVQLLKPAGRLFVYGANWGYEVAQFSRAGYEAIGYEISSARADFASQNLGVSVFKDIETIRAKSPFDVIYCSHVLEHVPNPDVVFTLFKDICAEAGYLILFVPNCGGKNAREQGVHWGPYSSSLHPLSFTSTFFTQALSNYGFRLVTTFSDPYDLQQISHLSSQNKTLGDELLIIAKKQG